MSAAHRSAATTLLAIDTATRLGSVAVGSPDHVRAELTIGAHARHAEALLPAIDFALRQANRSRAALTGVIAGAGPGSFTGVRIGAATAKAIAHALDIPLYVHSSLAVLAAGAAAPGRAVCALFDARRGDVYAACYRFEFPDRNGAPARMTTLLAPCTGPVTEIAMALAGHAPLWVGDGALRHAVQLARAGAVGPAALAEPRASALLWLHGLDPEAGRVTEPARWTPDYLRPPVPVPAGPSGAGRAPGPDARPSPGAGA